MWLVSCLLYQLAEVLKVVVSCLLGPSHQGEQTTGPRDSIVVTRGSKYLEPGARGSIHSGPQG